MDYYGNGNRSGLDKLNNVGLDRKFKGFKVSYTFKNRINHST
jgi:hypothetical protein